jgi:hypothetical protein
MPAERFIYALADWTVEKRADGWYSEPTLFDGDRQ